MTAPVLAVSFEGGGRGYQHPDTGLVVPSVTTVLKVLAQDWAIPWASKMVAEFAVDEKANWINLPRDAAIDVLKGSTRRKKEAGGASGTDVHEYAEKLLRGDKGVFLPPGTGTGADNIRGLIEAIKPTPIMLEGTVWSTKYGYAGSFDGIHGITQRDGHVALSLVDIKSSKDIFFETALQLAAYRFADEILMPDGTSVPMPEVEACYAWHAPKMPGTHWAVRPVEATEKEHAAFRACLYLWKWQAERKKQVIGPAIARGGA